MKTRRNIWPWGTNQPLGPRVSYGKRTRAASPAASRRPVSAKQAAKAKIRGFGQIGGVESGKKLPITVAEMGQLQSEENFRSDFPGAKQ